MKPYIRPLGRLQQRESTKTYYYLGLHGLVDPLAHHCWRAHNKQCCRAVSHYCASPRRHIRRRKFNGCGSLPKQAAGPILVHTMLTSGLFGPKCEYLYHEPRFAYKHTLCLRKKRVSNFMRYLHQLLTDFENSFTVGNSNKLSKNKYNISRHFLKSLFRYCVMYEVMDHHG